MQEELAELRTLPAMVDRLRNDNHNMLAQLRELWSAVGSLQADAPQHSMRLMENLALFEGRVTSILEAGGLLMDSSSPSMFLGERPNPLAISVEDLARSAPSVYGGLSGEPHATHLNSAPIPPIQGEVDALNSVQSVVNISHVARANDEMVVDSCADDRQPIESRPTSGPNPPSAMPDGLHVEAVALISSEMQVTPVGANAESHLIVPEVTDRPVVASYISPSCSPVRDWLPAIPTDTIALSSHPPSLPTVIVVTPLQPPLSPIIEVAEEPTQIDVEGVNQVPGEQKTTELDTTLVTDSTPGIPATDITPPIPATDVAPLMSTTDITPTILATNITPLTPTTNIAPPIPATDIAPLTSVPDAAPLIPTTKTDPPISATVVPPPSIMLPLVTSPPAIPPAPANAPLAVIPRASALTPQSAGHRNAKRARSSSVVSTRSSKRL